MARLYVGTMGYGYDDWDGVFYPSGVSGRERLAHYARMFEAVELDNTFYAIPRPTVVKGWETVTPPDFKFTAKIPQAITHEGRLVGVQDAFEMFLDTMSILDSKLGALLFQFPPDFSYDSVDAVQKFFSNLPSQFRFAAEFRHRSWYRQETGELLKQCNVCWTSIDYPPYPRHLEITSDFMYLRLIGRHGAFERHDRVQLDRSKELDWWEKQTRQQMPRVQQVFSFFNNDYAGYSPAIANQFKARMGQEVIEHAEPEQGTLF